MKNWKSDLLAIKKKLAAQVQTASATTNSKTTPQVSAATPTKLAERTVTSATPSSVLASTSTRTSVEKQKVGKHIAQRTHSHSPTSGKTQNTNSTSTTQKFANSVQAVHTKQPVCKSGHRDKILVSAASKSTVAIESQSRGTSAPPVPASIRALRKVSTERQKLFREAAHWVGSGAQTQLSSTSANARAIDVVIGIDFGTSYTKAAVGMLDKIYPVNWSGVTNCPEALLLPSEYTALPDGTVFLGQRPGAVEDEVKLDIKLPFIHPHVSIKSVATASVFLAQVLRYVRAWVYEFHRKKIGDAKIRWQLNLGAPCNGLEDARLTTAFRRLGNTAWLLSQRGIEVGMADAVEIAAAWQSGTTAVDLFALDVFPEFVAQMAGYVQSSQRQRGLHALADVGGGTLDVVTFIVHQVDHEDTFPFLVPEVKSLGTHMLNQNRIVGASLDAVIRMPDELMPVLDATAFAAATSIDPNHVKSRDYIFYMQISHVVKNVLAVTKARRYRRSEAWGSGLRTFLTGGGANAEGYSEAIKRGGLNCASRIDLIPLPLHPRIDDFNGSVQDYQRISVACGLAQDAFSLGRIIAAKDVEDDRAVVSHTRERLDRDELYAK
ncbi:hypothetical protein ABC383_17710 [Noviherbaspirillum sp. 1P10PC]|uniref:hypothetical protein n=1 Tax=Noviherbaspirillum sp. 1P10PC TaxID=3132292 RepID=UPI0039A10D44